MSDMSSLTNLLSLLSNGSICTISTTFSNGVELSADGSHVVFNGDVRAITQMLAQQGESVKATKTTTPDRPKTQAPIRNFIPSATENPHPGHLTSTFDGTEFRLDVDYLVSDDDIRTYSLLTRAELLVFLKPVQASTLDLYLPRAPRFVKNGKYTIFYHQSHVYQILSDIVATGNVKAKIDKSDCDKLLTRILSDTNPIPPIPVPEKMLWNHVDQNPWLVSYRALTASMKIVESMKGISAFMHSMISKDRPGLLDIRAVLKEYPEDYDISPRWVCLHKGQRNYLRRCIFEINNYAKRHDIDPGHDYDDLDLTPETFNGEPA